MIQFSNTKLSDIKRSISTTLLLDNDLDHFAEHARQLGLVLDKRSTELPTRFSEKSAKEYAAEVMRRFTAMNEIVWRAEKVLEAPTQETRRVRELGEWMHSWYETWKSRVAFALGLEFHGQHWPVQPYFDELFQEVIDRASQSDPIAAAYAETHWAMSFAKQVQAS